MVNFSKTFNQNQEPIATISGQFAAGPVKKMQVIKFSTIKIDQYENSLENSHSIQQIVKQNSSRASLNKDDPSYDNQQRIF